MIKNYEMGEHINSSDREIKCEICKKLIPIDSEIVVTSFGGHADPVYGFSCSNCVNKANRNAGF